MPRRPSTPRPGFFYSDDMNDGWIKLYRKIQDSEMYRNLSSKQRDVMIQCLIMANHDQKSWEWGAEIFECKPGQFITSLENLRSKCARDVKVQSVRTSLLKLEKWQFLTNESTKTGRLITICKWDTYQLSENGVNKDDNKQPTKSQQRANKELTTNKNDKNVKNDKEINISFDVFWNLYDKKVGNKSKCEKMWNKLKDDERQKSIDTLPAWKIHIKDKQFQPFPETYLNQRRWNDELENGKDCYFVDGVKYER